MNQQELIQIEKELGITLPSDYKNVMMDYPIPGGDCETYALCNDVSDVIKENLDLRQNGFFGSPWPDHFYALGLNGCGDYYFIDLKEERRMIYFADHESPFHNDQLEIIGDDDKWEGFDSYIKYLEEIEAEIEHVEAEDEDKEFKQKTKKWWQLWR